MFTNFLLQILRQLLLLLPIFFCSCSVDKSFIFFPNQKIDATPADINLPFEDLYLTTKDNVTINAWFVPHPQAKATLLWFHGNGGNLSNRIDQLQMFHALLPVNILMIDYREYGRSRGKVSEEGTYQDAEAAYDYLIKQKTPGKIISYGQSLGSAVALELALRRPVNALIVEAPFASISKMAKVRYGWLPLDWLITTRYDNLSKIGKAPVPVMIMHSNHDEIIPYEHGKQLFDVANEPKQFYTIHGKHHNDTYTDAGYIQNIKLFLGID